MQAALDATLKGFHELATPSTPTNRPTSPSPSNAHTPSRSTADSMAKRQAVQPVSPRSPNSRTYKSYSNSLFVSISTTALKTPEVPQRSMPQSVVTSEAKKVEAAGSRLRSVLDLWGGQLLAAAQQHGTDKAALADTQMQLAQQAAAA